MRRALLLLLSLTGCTNDQVVEARVEHGRLVLDTRPGESKCLGFLRVTRGAETMWEIVAKGPRGEQRMCAGRFPLTYGHLPPGFTEAVSAKAPTSATYLLVGTGEKFLRAAFRFDGRSVTNAAPDSAEWCAIQYPGSHRNWAGGCSIDSANN